MGMAARARASPAAAGAASRVNRVTCVCGVRAACVSARSVVPREPRVQCAAHRPSRH